MSILERISTGVPGLDSLIDGGIPRGSTVMVAGKSGSCKSILCAQFIYDGLINKNENGLYISFSESKVQFYANIKTVGMDFVKFEKQNKVTYLDFASLTKDGIRDALEEILATIRTTNPKRLVLDSFSAVSLAFESPSEARIAVQVLLGKIMRSEGITSMLVMEVPYGRENFGSGIEESVVDGIIRLDHREDNASPIILTVFKMRGTSINREPHVCTISKSGLVLYPKQSLRLNYAAIEERVSSGITGLDERIGNGLIKGTTTVITGASGTAKSTFAFQFVAEGLRKKTEPGIFLSLEETVDGVRMMAKGYGYNIEELQNSGLTILTGNAEDESPDAIIANLAAEIKKTKAKRLAIDGLSAFESKYNQNDMYKITKRFVSLIQQYKITAVVTILTTQNNGFDATEMGLSSLMQNTILLRFVEIQGRIRRILLIQKMRGSNHEKSMLEFTISADKESGGGAMIVGPIDNSYTGIYSGVAQIAVDE